MPGIGGQAPAQGSQFTERAPPVGLGRAASEELRLDRIKLIRSRLDQGPKPARSDDRFKLLRSYPQFTLTSNGIERQDEASQRRQQQESRRDTQRYWEVLQPGLLF